MAPLSRVLALLLCSAPLLAQASSPVYERSGDGWMRLENGRAFAVHPGVISARFATPLADLPAFLGQLSGDGAGLTVVRSNRLGIVDLALPLGADPLAAVAALRASGAVEFAEENCLGSYTATPNDPNFGSLWHLNNTGQTGGSVDADVDAPEAWDLEDGDPSIVVAVLDSGTQWLHPDLFANIWNNPGELSNGLDDDGNGFVDDIVGWDFDNNDADPTGLFYHGTAVAGVVGAVGNNGTLIVGLAGGAVDGEGVSIMPLNVGNFSPDASVIDDAILYAADNGAHVITLSLTVPASSAIDAALTYAWHTRGVFIDCASGNNGFGVGYPALHPDVMAVASTNHSDIKSGFSNAGPEVEVSAPGENILMCNLGGGTITQSGTSFSAPHVAALAALMLSVDPTLTNDTLRSLLRSTSDDVGPAGWDSGTGDGRINAASALAAVSAGFVVGQVLPYGTGLAGGNGLTPLIATGSGQLPSKGDGSFAVSLRQAALSAPALLLVGISQAAMPFKGGVLLVDVNLPHAAASMTTSATGSGSLSLPIPDDDLLVGLSAFVQWLVADVGGPAGIALSPGLELVIGS